MGFPISPPKCLHVSLAVCGIAQDLLDLGSKLVKSKDVKNIHVKLMNECNMNRDDYFNIVISTQAFA